jgi:hypothetical protein
MYLYTQAKMLGSSCPASQKEEIISFYDGFFLSVFYAYELQFYDVFSFYHKA